MRKSYHRTPQDRVLLKLIASNLRRLRLRRRLTQEGLAELLGMSPRLLQIHESGRSNPTAIKLARFARALGADVKDFFRKTKH